MNNVTGNFSPKKSCHDFLYTCSKLNSKIVSNTTLKQDTLLKKIAIVPVVLLIVLVFSGCSKDNKPCSPKSPASEAPQMQAYAAANGITLTAHPSGLQYEIITQGSGPVANVNSKIKITYTGKFMNGTTFDEMTTPNADPWNLSGLIEGWIIGIPLIQEGGHIKLLVPSSMAYGCDQYYSIPGNSVLYFDIHLIDVQ